MVDVDFAEVSMDPTAALQGVFQQGIFEDLADGAHFARASVSAYGAAQVRVPLNEAGLAGLQAAQGRFSLGLSIAPEEASYAYAFECQSGAEVQLLLCRAEDEQDGDGRRRTIWPPSA